MILIFPLAYCPPIINALYLLQACKLKLGDLKGALLDTEFAMRDGDDNVKALFRQGQVSIIHH